MDKRLRRIVQGYGRALDQCDYRPGATKSAKDGEGEAAFSSTSILPLPPDTVAVPMDYKSEKGKEEEEMVERPVVRSGDDQKHSLLRLPAKRPRPVASPANDSHHVHQPQQPQVHRQHLPFGYFTGSALFRNCLHPTQELLEDGHVSLDNLIPPHCHSAFITTFEPPTTQWVVQVLGDIPNVVVLCHYWPAGPSSLSPSPSLQSTTKDAESGEKADEASLAGSIIGQSLDARALFAQRPSWRWIAARPHAGGLMHAKILLFSCPDKGLRVVVSGNNFTDKQWHTERDCLWVQDLPPASSATATATATTKTNHGGLHRLQSFLRDLTAGSGSRGEGTFVCQFIHDLFQNIPDTIHPQVQFVYSFPRRTSLAKSDNGGGDGDAVRGDRGGWRHLALAMARFRRESSRTCQPGKSQDDMDNLHLYAMSGSLGDLRAEFLCQIRLAMNGLVSEPVTDLDDSWDHVKRTYVLWPSAQTCQTMDPMSFLGSARPMAKAHWESIPLANRRKVFHDAIPAPSTKALGKYHTFAHGKVILAELDDFFGAIYIGSHNFSKAAWGLRGTSPKNVEFGVLLYTTESIVVEEWKSRLPYCLPIKDSVSPEDYEMGRGGHVDLPVLTMPQPIPLGGDPTTAISAAAPP